MQHESLEPWSAPHFSSWRTAEWGGPHNPELARAPRVGGLTSTTPCSLRGRSMHLSYLRPPHRLLTSSALKLEEKICYKKKEKRSILYSDGWIHVWMPAAKFIWCRQGQTTSTFRPHALLDTWVRFMSKWLRWLKSPLKIKVFLWFRMSVPQIIA